MVLGITLNCTEDSVSNLKDCFPVITWKTVDFGDRYRQTDILVSLSFGLAENHSLLTTARQTAQVWERRFLKSYSFKLDVSLGWQFYENFVPTKNGFY